MQNICLLYNNSSFGNIDNKKKIAGLGVLENLINIFKFYTQKRNDLCFNTLKNCLKSIGNLSLVLENANSILGKEKFVKAVDEFIFKEKKFNISKKSSLQLIKLILDIIANLASFPEEINYINLVEMIDQGVVNVLIR